MFLSSKAKINLSRGELIECALKNNEGSLTKHGALYVETGECTGRSPNAKFIVEDDVSSDTVDWTNNQKMSQEEWKKFKRDYFLKSSAKDLYLQDLEAGRDPSCSIRVKVLTELAYHSLFARNMFCKRHWREDTEPQEEWDLFNVPSIGDTPRVIISLKEKLVLITGTMYAGEIKKSIFTVLNFLYPTKYDFLPMHCSVNLDKEGLNPAIFFGLSGTGKTTLSSDVNRILIGDDEHGWTNNGLCNFEGGCYAKTIRLSKEDEPQIVFPGRNIDV